MKCLAYPTESQEVLLVVSTSAFTLQPVHVGAGLQELQKAAKWSEQLTVVLR